MKEIHVLHTFANESSVPYISWFAERAAKEGGIRYSFLLMHTERPAMLDEMAKYGFSCAWIPYDQHKRKRGLLRATPWLLYHMLKLRPDIVHCHMFDDTVAGLFAAWVARIKVRIMSRQDTGYHWNHAPRWVFMDRWNTDRATHIIAISTESRRHMVEKEGVDPKKITLVHNGIPPAFYTDQREETKVRLRERFGISDHHPVIGTVARFIGWKGYRHIVDAAVLIVREHPTARFLFCGHGPEEQQVRNWVKEAGLEANVVFTGWVARKDMASFMGILDLYLHAADMEPFGLIYPEAMMNAVPVVSTATGAALDAIEDGTNGILVRERNGAALAAGVERLLTLDRKSIGEAGKRTALEMYSFDTMWNGTVGLYRSALGMS